MDLNRRLLLAVAEGHTEGVRALIGAGADPSAVGPHNGWSALCVAVEHDRPEMVAVLIEFGADVNWQSPTGWTALHHAVDAEGDFAAQVGSPKDLRLVKPLLLAGADPTIPCRGETALDLARSYRHDAAVEAIQLSHP